MAYTTKNIAISPAYSGVIANFIQAMKEKYAAHQIYRRTLLELSELTERELNDIGISHRDIDAIAYETAYGPAR